MIPPRAKSLIIEETNKLILSIKHFNTYNPIIIIGQSKYDRIDHKLIKEANKINQREINDNVKVQHGGRYQNRRKGAITYRSYSVQFKKKLIDKIRQLNKNTDMGLSKIIRTKARQLSIHPKNIFRWYHTKQIKKKQGGRKALYPEMEERLAQFILNNPKMKRKHILRQAKQIMEDLQIPGREYFNFSKGWYERFRERLIKQKVLPGLKRNRNSLKKEKKEFIDDESQEFDFDEESDDGVKYQQDSYVKQEQNDESYEENVKKEEFDELVKYQIIGEHKYNQDSSNQENNLILIYEDFIKEEDPNLKACQDLCKTNDSLSLSKSRNLMQSFGQYDENTENNSNKNNYATRSKDSKK